MMSSCLVLDPLGEAAAAQQLILLSRMTPFFVFQPFSFPMPASPSSNSDSACSSNKILDVSCYESESMPPSSLNMTFVTHSVTFGWSPTRELGRVLVSTKGPSQRKLGGLKLRSKSIRIGLLFAPGQRVYMCQGGIKNHLEFSEEALIVDEHGRINDACHQVTMEPTELDPTGALQLLNLNASLFKGTTKGCMKHGTSNLWPKALRRPDQRSWWFEARLADGSLVASSEKFQAQNEQFGPRAAMEEALF